MGDKKRRSSNACGKQVKALRWQAKQAETKKAKVAAAKKGTGGRRGFARGARAGRAKQRGRYERDHHVFPAAIQRSLATLGKDKAAGRKPDVFVWLETRFSCKDLPEIENLRLEAEELLQLETDDPSGRPDTYEADLLQTVAKMDALRARSTGSWRASCRLG